MNTIGCGKLGAGNSVREIRCGKLMREIGAAMNWYGDSRINPLEGYSAITVAPSHLAFKKVSHPEPPALLSQHLTPPIYYQDSSLLSNHSLYSLCPLSEEPHGGLAIFAINRRGNATVLPGLTKENQVVQDASPRKGNAILKPLSKQMYSSANV